MDSERLDQVIDLTTELLKIILKETLSGNGSDHKEKLPQPKEEPSGK